MLVRALLQTSLVLWLAQQTLQGGVKPQSVSWGRVLPARGVGIGVKPGVAGALGALGSRYGTKAMKSGIGRYPGAQLGVGGYRALGLGSRAGLKPGYGTQGAYGASLGLGTGLPNGVGLGLGQGGKRVYGAGLGTLPGYGALAGIGYPGARPGLGLGYPTGHGAKEQKPGVPTDDMGGPEVAGLGQAVQDLKRKKSAALGHLYGNRALLGPAAPELQVEAGLRPAVLPPGREALKSPEKQTKGPPVPHIPRGESFDPTLLERRGSAGHGASLAAAGVRQQLPLDKDDVRGVARHYDPSVPQHQPGRNCGQARDLLPIDRHELLGSEIRGSQSLPPQPHAGKDGKHLGHQQHHVGSNVFSPPQSQGGYLSAAADGQAVKDFGLVAKDKSGPRIRGTVTVENPSRGGPLNLQGGVSFGPANPAARGAQSLGVAAVKAKEGKGFAAEGQEAQRLGLAEHELAKSKGVSVPGQAGRNSQASSYIGGPGSYLGAGSLGAGGYAPGLGQGAYLGGAAGRAAALGQGGYPHGGAGMSTGYGDGVTGYLGAMGGNGYGGDAGGKTLSTGYGNGFGDGYGAGLGYPSELADVAESKAGKSEALSTGAYAGQVQGAYGALGAGLESNGGKYGAGAAQGPYGNAPVIPTGLEGDGGYPYGAQQLALGTEGAKAASKYGAAAGYGAQQTGYGAQLGATQDVLGEQAGKYGGVNGALGNGYKG